MKFRGHETFFIRRNWISKGIKNIIKDPSAFMGGNENPMDVLGIGANMVKSLRYWLQVLGISNENITGKRVQTLTEFGRIIWENDPYLQEDGTLLLLHYKLSSNKDLGTAWYYFFNEFVMNEFTKEELEESLKIYALKNDVKVSERAVSDDVSCLVNTYSTKEKGEIKSQDPEDNMKCPLEDLELIKLVDKKEKTYKKNMINPERIDPLIALAIIVDQSNNKKEIKISELQYKNNIGKIFNLDIIEILKILRKLEILGYLKMIRTAGLDIIKIEKDINFLKCIKRYYYNINYEEKY